MTLFVWIGFFMGAVQAFLLPLQLQKGTYERGE